MKQGSLLLISLLSAAAHGQGRLADGLVTIRTFSHVTEAQIAAVAGPTRLRR